MGTRENTHTFRGVIRSHLMGRDTLLTGRGWAHAVPGSDSLTPEGRGHSCSARRGLKHAWSCARLPAAWRPSR